MKEIENWRRQMELKIFSDSYLSFKDSDKSNPYYYYIVEHELNRLLNREINLIYLDHFKKLTGWTGL